MRMKFRCKNCGRVFNFRDRETKAVVEFMEARQKMYKTLWNKDFDSGNDTGINMIIERNVKCCEFPNVQIVEFHGFE